jgi:hypothetical protein
MPPTPTLRLELDERKARVLELMASRLGTTPAELVRRVLIAAARTSTEFRQT